MVSGPRVGVRRRPGMATYYLLLPPCAGGRSNPYANMDKTTVMQEVLENPVSEYSFAALAAAARVTLARCEVLASSLSL